MPTMTPTLGALVKYEAPSQYSREDVTVASGQNLAFGTIVARLNTGGKIVAASSGGSDGSQTAIGVITAAVNASAADAPGVIVARHAVVAKDALVYGAGLDNQPKKDAALAQLKTAGIVARATV